MIDVKLHKLLFFDLETAGYEKDLPSLRKSKPELARLFESYKNWFTKTYTDEEDNSIVDIFVNRAALVPEFARIVTASFGFFTENGDYHKKCFASTDERAMLIDIRDLLDRIYAQNYYLCGHNIKFFDIPMLGKRFLVNGLRPPKILPTHDTKPWEVMAVDTKDLWQFGNRYSISSLDLMCVSLDIPSPKTGEVSGNMVHDTFWNKGEEGLKSIADYCDRDVKVLADALYKIYNLD